MTASDTHALPQAQPARRARSGGPGLWVGIDVAKASLHLCALDQSGHTVWSRRIPNTEDAIRQAIIDAAGPGRRRTVVWALDMTSGATALPITVLAAALQPMRYVPGRLVARVSGGLAGGEAKTDARDARTIAEIARMRTDLHPITGPESLIADLRVLMSHRDDLIGDRVAAVNRLREQLASIFPTLEQEFDYSTRSALTLLTLYQTPAPLRRKGSVDRLAAHLRRAGVRGVRPGGVRAMAERAVAAAARQRITLPAQSLTARLIERRARQLLQQEDEITALTAEIEHLFHRHPWADILTSVPGIGTLLGARFLIETGGNLSARFGTEPKLAAYTGLAPVPRASGAIQTSQRRPLRYNRHLRQMFYLAAVAAIKQSQGPSRFYYDKKRDEGKLHAQALLCLSRQLCKLVWALIRDQRPYRTDTPAASVADHSHSRPDAGGDIP